MLAIAAGADVPWHVTGRLDHAVRLAAGRIPDPPYPGIRPFEEQEWPIFFGRQGIVDELLARLETNRFVAVIGASGGGKSSVIRAGLFATLKRKHARLGVRWRTATMRPAGSPMWSLAEALHRALHPPPADEPTRVPSVDEIVPLRARLALGAHAIADVLKEERFPEDHNLLLLVDQFEELFRYDILGGAAEVRSFLNQLVDVVERPPAGFYLALTMRSDFLGECARFPRFADALNRSGYLLRRMNDDEIKEAIVRPAQLLGGALEPALVDRLLQNTHGEQDDLPLLQHALMWLWALERRQQRAKGGASEAPLALRLADYEAMGGMAGALSQHASEIYDELGGRSPDEASQESALQRTAKRLFLALSDVDNHGRVVRRPQRFARLAEEAGVSPDDVRAVIDAFRAPGHSFLMPPVPAALDDDKVVDVCHEALIRNWNSLRDWIGENREFLRTKERVAQAAARWQSESREPSLLLPRGLPLAEADEILKARRSEIAPDIMEFIEASIAAKHAQDDEELRRERERQQSEAEANAAKERELAARRLTRRTVFGATVAGFLAVSAAGLAWYATIQTEQVRAQAKIMESLRLATLSEQATASGNATNGILLALEALGNGVDGPQLHVPEAEAALYAGVVEHREKLLLRGRAGIVWSAAFSVDGRWLVTASSDDKARLWDATTGQEIRVLSGHLDDVRSAAFSADGSRIVTASNDKTARVWDATTGRELLVLHGKAPILSAAFSADGSRVVTASSDRTARLWDASTGEELQILRGHEDRVWSAAFSADGNWVVTASDDRTARLWEVNTGRAVAVLRGHTRAVLSAAFSTDGSRVVTASNDFTARLWDAGTGKELAVLRGHKGEVRWAAFSTDGHRVVTASNDRTAQLWDASTGQTLAVLGGHWNKVLSAAFNADGSRVVTASSDGTTRLWEAWTGEAVTVLRGHGSWVQSAEFSADGSRVATASDDGTVRLWDASTGLLLAVLSGHKDRVWSAVFSADGSKVVTGSEDGTARLWKGGTSRVLNGHSGAVLSAEFNPDGSRVVTASWDDTARLWDGDTGHELAVLRHTGPVRSATFSTDGSRIVTASNDKTAGLWDAVTGEKLAVLSGHEGYLLLAVFSADGSRVVTASEDSTARLWDAGTGKELVVLRGHENGVRSAAFSPDGRRVATASWDGTARLWDADTGKELAVLRGHEGEVLWAAFNSDGSRLATASSDGTARLWNAHTGKEVAVLRGHEGGVRSVVFSADGTRVVTASMDGTARIWRLFPTTEALIVYAKNIAPRQLTEVECRRYFPAAEPAPVIADVVASIFAPTLSLHACPGTAAVQDGR